VRLSVHLGNSTRIAETSLLATKGNDKEPHQWKKEGGGPQSCVERLKFGAMAVRCAPTHCPVESTRTGFAIVWDTSADRLARTLQNLPVEVLIYPLGLEKQVSDERGPYIVLFDITCVY
jgi:hypothetical protein